jgi:hypothetical protein
VTGRVGSDKPESTTRRDIAVAARTERVEDRKKMFCVYDAPSPEAIRKTAARNGLPVDRITQVRVLDPYFYR